jgi:ABC-type tungstate transport system substrate-binding protein
MENIEVYVTAIGTIIVVLGVVITMMYTRFDEHKKRMEDTHITKDFFALAHRQLIVDISEIKADIKTLLRNGKDK